jgi:hypothetical protein
VRTHETTALTGGSGVFGGGAGVGFLALLWIMVTVWGVLLLQAAWLARSKWQADGH